MARLGRAALPPALGAELAEAGWAGWGFARALLEPHRLRGAVRLGVEEPPAWVGAGRALWFATAGDVAAVEARLARVDAAVAPYLACGVGLASAFSGGATEQALARLGALAGFTEGHERGARERALGG